MWTDTRRRTAAGLDHTLERVRGRREDVWMGRLECEGKMEG